jgi:hypothetical protein
VVEEFGFKPADVLDRYGVEVTARTKEDRDDLLLDRQRVILRLLEQFHQPRTALQLRLGGGVQV